MHSKPVSSALTSASAPRRRRGISIIWVMAGLTMVAIPLGVVAVPMMFGDKAAEGEAPIVYKVSRGLFTHDVTEPGEIESSNNVEVRCEVQSNNTSGTVILEIVPAGTIVKPGDILIKFDASALESERTAQQSLLNTSQAGVVQAQNIYDTAIISKQEYLEGTYKQEQQLIQSEVFVAEENVRRAKEYFQYSQRLAARGYTTAIQVEADRFAVEKAAKELETAKTKLGVLQEFTQAKMLKQLEADIQTAKAKLDAEKNTYKLVADKLSLIELQIQKCVVRAPTAGKVVYANKADGRGNNEIVIEEGAIIRERQAVIRLPDMSKMQVVAKINESRIGYVQVGMPATVQLDALPEVKLRGVVKKVDEYPLPRGWMNSSIKQYATTIEILQTHPAMRPGMTAQAKIHVSASRNALSVPVQAIVDRGGAHYCLLKGQSGWETRKVAVGASNNEFVMIREKDLSDGEQVLNEGEEVVLNPRQFLDQVDLPDEEAPPQAEVVAQAEPGSADAARPVADASSGGPRPQQSAQADGGRAVGPSSGPRGEGRGRMDPAAMIQTMDRDGDQKLSQDELPEMMRDRILAADVNGDGLIDRPELTAAMAKLRAMGGGSEGGPPGGWSGGGQ